MRILCRILLVGVVTLAGPRTGFGQTLLPELEIYQQETIVKETGQVRSRLKGHFQKIAENRYRLIKSGRGDYGKFQNVAWTIESETELRNRELCPLRTVLTVKNQDGEIIFTSIAIYDYEQQRLRVTQRGEKKEHIKEPTFPLKKPVSDHASLIYFLKPFIRDLQAGQTVQFFFLSGEPAQYSLKARLVGTDKLTVGSQERETTKISVTPDMGPLNIIVDKILPPTLLWYDQKPPHAWLKYQGLECGRGSVSIVTNVTAITRLK